MHRFAERERRQRIYCSGGSPLEETHENFGDRFGGSARIGVAGERRHGLDAPAIRAGDARRRWRRAIGRRRRHDAAVRRNCRDSWNRRRARPGDNARAVRAAAPRSRTAGTAGTTRQTEGRREGSRTNIRANVRIGGRDSVRTRTSTSTRFGVRTRVGGSDDVVIRRKNARRYVYSEPNRSTSSARRKCAVTSTASRAAFIIKRKKVRRYTYDEPSAPPSCTGAAPASRSASASRPAPACASAARARRRERQHPRLGDDALVHDDALIEAATRRVAPTPTRSRPHRVRVRRRIGRSAGPRKRRRVGRHADPRNVRRRTAAVAAVVGRPPVDTPQWRMRPSWPHPRSRTERVRIYRCVGTVSDSSSPQRAQR